MAVLKEYVKFYRRNIFAVEYSLRVSVVVFPYLESKKFPFGSINDTNILLSEVILRKILFL